ncbi:MAG: hypothetical protein JEZ14_25145 [Marinilabiliaceae bacterium]|nr:hypothetical protein [Marinilabiliaceae bacterium]
MAPSGDKGAGILTFWHKKVSMHGEPFTFKVEYSTDNGQSWNEIHSRTFQASDAMIWSSNL